MRFTVLSLQCFDAGFFKPHKMKKTIFFHDNFNLIKDNAAAPSVMQCHAQEREPETCEPTPGPSWL